MKTSWTLPFITTAALAASLRLTAADADSYEDWHKKMMPLIPRGYVCQHATAPITMDGKLDDAAWAAAPWTEDFVDIEGPAKPKPRFRTRAKMLWDDTYLYIGAELEEPNVWATLTEHDAVIFNDPDFEVFMDPDGDTHNYFEFEMNALNTGWDLFLPKPYKDGGKADNSWEIPGLKTAVHIRGTLNNPADRDEGWSVEIAFPWSALTAKAPFRAPPHEGDQMRMGFSRVEWQIDTSAGRYQKVPKTPEDNWIWSPQGVVDMHRPERWGYVQFTKKKDAQFVSDGTAPARDALFDVYYAQRAFHKKNNRWAKTLEELGLAPQATRTMSVPRLRETADGWEAGVSLSRSGASPEQWNIRQDSRVWLEK